MRPPVRPHRPVLPRPPAPRARPAVVRPIAATPSSSSPSPPATAAASVEAGLAAFQSGDPAAALALFQRARTLSPSDDEARAATYNAACALTALKRYREAADAVVAAVNEHGLKLDVAAADPDLRALRDRREWLDALEVAKGGVTTGSVVAARAEARAPFRGARLFLSGGVGAGAAVGLLIILSRLAAALKGGDGAPDVNETLRNLAINGVAVAALGWVFARDFKAAAKDKAASAREEALARLTVTLADGRVVPLTKFRGSARPVLVSGPPGALARALKEAEPYRADLAARGVRVVPVETGAADPDGALRALKAELRGERPVAEGSGGSGRPAKGFGAPASTASASSAASPAERNWTLAPAAPGEWRAWLDETAAEAGIGGASFYVQVQLDGRVRASGVGAPPWAALARDLPPLDSLQTKLTDGAARM